MKQLLLTVFLLSTFIGLPGGVYSKFDGVASTRYFAECRIVAVTSSSAEMDCEVLVLRASERSEEQVALIRKHFSAARTLEVKFNGKSKSHNAVVLRHPDENLSMSLRLRGTNRQFNLGKVFKIEVFLDGT